MASKTTVPTPSRRKRAAAPAPAPVEPAPAAGGLPSTEELLRAGLKAFRLENLLGLGQHAKAPRAEAPAPGLGFPSLDSFGFRKFEDVFDQRVAGALQRLGWPTADDVAALHAEIEQLKAQTQSSADDKQALLARLREEAQAIESTLAALH